MGRLISLPRAHCDQVYSNQSVCHNVLATADAWVLPSCFLRAETASKADAVTSLQHQRVLEELQQQLPLLIDGSPLQVLQQAHFWEFAQAAAETTPPLAQDLPVLGYDLDLAALLAAQQLQQLQELLGLQVSDLQKDLQQFHKSDGNAFSTGSQQAHMVAAVAANQEARQKLAQLQLIQVLAQALGLSSVQLSGPVSACELVLRLTGVTLQQQQQQQLNVSSQLEQLLVAAAPQLLVAVSQLPSSALMQPSVESLLQLMNSQETLKVCRHEPCRELRHWSSGLFRFWSVSLI